MSRKKHTSTALSNIWYHNGYNGVKAASNGIDILLYSTKIITNKSHLTHQGLLCLKKHNHFFCDFMNSSFLSPLKEITLVLWLEGSGR